MATVYPRDINANVGAVGQNAILVGPDAVDQMILYVMTTLRGSRHHQPEFGTEIPTLLFEPVDSTTGRDIESEIYANLEPQIPYIRLDNANTSVEPNPDQDEYYVRVAYFDTKTGLIRNFDVVLRKQGA